jgi:acyl-CoA synthetase (NDP forming)
MNLQHYGGRVYPVNARYERIGEQRCYPNVSALPEVPNCAVITAAREAVEEIVLECARIGVGGMIIFASGYAETGKADRIAQQHRLASIAQETGMRIVGPNCIGVVNALLDMRDLHGHYADTAATPAFHRHGEPIRCARHGGGTGGGARCVVQPCDDIGQFLRCRHGGLHFLSRG